MQKYSVDDLICWHNGEFKSIKDVHVSVLDFGFIHSDATYDVFRTRNGKALHYPLHADRFKKSCAYFGFQEIENLEEIAEELLNKNSLQDAFVWACVWRGRPPSGSPRDMSGPQNAFVYVKPYYSLGIQQGLKLLVSENYRRVPDICYNQHSKNFGWIELTLAQKEAQSKGYDSALLLSVDNFLTEGPGFGICFYRDGEVITPKRDCLSSITIQVLEQTCSAHGIAFSRKDISLEEALSATEAYACSTSGGLTPVAGINAKQYEAEFFTELNSKFENYSNNGAH